MSASRPAVQMALGADHTVDSTGKRAIGKGGPGWRSGRTSVG